MDGLLKAYNKIKPRRAPSFFIALTCLIVFCGSYAGGEHGEPVSIDSKATVAEFMGGAPVFPLRRRFPVEIEAIKIPAADRIIAHVKSNLGDSEVRASMYLTIGGEEVDSRSLVLQAGATEEIVYDLPGLMTGANRISVAVDPEKPDGLPAAESSMDFSRRARVQTFSIDDFIKIPHVDCDGSSRAESSGLEGQPYIRIGRERDIYPLHMRNVWKGPLDLSANIFLSWCADNIHLAVEVSDDEHFNTRTGHSIWDGDALQFAFLPFSGDNGDPFFLGLALASGEVQSYKWDGPRTGLLENSDYNVGRDDESLKTFYEINIPFDRLGMEGRKGVLFGFNAVVFDDDDGEGYDYWAQIGPGITGGLDPEQFKVFILWDDE